MAPLTEISLVSGIVHCIFLRSLVRKERQLALAFSLIGVIWIFFAVLSVFLVGGCVRVSDQTVGGMVADIDYSSRILTLKTRMGELEEIKCNEETLLCQVVSEDSLVVLDFRDLYPGDSVMVGYWIREGLVVADWIQLTDIASCSCGQDCDCPPSEACRIMRDEPPSGQRI